MATAREFWNRNAVAAELSSEENVMGWSSEEVDWNAASGHVVEHDELRSEETDRTMRQDTLLREMQHRVANSLQIVAGMLLLKARTIKSEDARLHLLDAYGRVTSVAAVQRQLLQTKPASVRL